MKLKKFGFIIFIIGILYMFIDGWLISWWLVPDYRSAGQAFISGNSVYSSNSFFTFWALSVPLGSIITVAGLAVYAHLEKWRFLIFFISSIIFLSWLAFWSQSIVYPALYGIGGGLILISFSFSIWTLIKMRMSCPEKLKTVLDFRIIGYVLLVITAWGMCGLLGIPSFGLRPEELIKYDTEGMLITMGAKVLICFTLGWIMIAISQVLEYKSYKIAA
jgi:hypothetical protein